MNNGDFYFELEEIQRIVSDLKNKIINMQEIQNDLYNKFLRFEETWSSDVSLEDCEKIKSFLGTADNSFLSSINNINLKNVDNLQRVIIKLDDLKHTGIQ